jgi:hypothetical protein
VLVVVETVVMIVVVGDDVTVGECEEVEVEVAAVVVPEVVSDDSSK